MPVADWGTVTVGRLVLRETFEATLNLNTATNKRTLGLRGEESSPPLTVAQVVQRQEDILGLLDRFVPISFTYKNDQDGFYNITDVNTELTNWTNEVTKFTWTIQAEFYGPEGSVDIDSRLTQINRLNAFSLAGEKWHAPAGGAYGYYTGTSQPSGSIARPSADGTAITVYRGLPTGVSPRWGSSPAVYQNGRARVLIGGVERTATRVIVSASAANWSVENALVRVQPGASATLQVSAWDGTAWDRIDWNVSVTASASGPITSWDSVAIIRNDYELCTVRLLKGNAPGRTTLDVSLRRGARAAELYLATDIGTTKSFYRATAEAGTAPASAAYQAATANDAGGNRYVIGTAASTVTYQAAQGGITKSAVATLDAFIGAQVAGSSAVAGDLATVIRDHYMATNSETSTGVRR
jgi:hypothetical protein